MTIEYFFAALVLACVSAYLAWRNNFKSRQAAGAIAFRTAFADTLSALRNTDADTFQTLSESFAIHESAVLEFSRFLTYFSRKAFLKAWNKSAYHEQQPNYPFLEQYSGAGQSISESKRLRNLSINRIEHILSYAKYT